MPHVSSTSSDFLIGYVKSRGSSRPLLVAPNYFDSLFKSSCLIPIPTMGVMLLGTQTTDWNK